MASLQKENKLNVPGPVFVDTTCIDCGTCYHLAPRTFSEEEGRSVVISQPEDLSTWGQAKRAIVSCPTNSIGIREHSDDFKQAPLSLPLKIADNVSYCGFTSRDSYGASAYLIETSEGNVLIDSPRFHPLLVKELEHRGGVAKMILTHQDDVADHDLFAEHFGCERYMHARDINSASIRVEQQLTFTDEFEIAKGLKLIFTPGHSPGHIVILYEDTFLFTGDHVFVEGQTLSASRSVCWFSWSEQIRSTERLKREKFSWVLPGHGGYGLIQNKERALTELIVRMKEKA